MMQRRLCVLALFLAVFSAAPAFGSTITVTNNSDSGPGSLRAAIAAAAPGDTINFNLTYPATITLVSPLQISTNLTISGPGSSSLTISGNKTVSVLMVWGGATVNISGVAIANGNGFEGGGIYSLASTLTLENVTLTNNSAPGYGGGIFNYAGTMTLDNCTVSANSASEYGGGIFNYGGTVIVSSSTVSGNQSAYDGGGIYNMGGTLNLTNSTLSGNSAGINGGAIWSSNYGAVTLTSVTFSGNSAPHGGGLSNYYYSGVTLKNAVLANSTGGNCWSLGGTATSNGYNLSDDSSCAGLLTATTDRNNTAAGLDTNGLQDNGGPTKTVALLSTSPAIDAVPLSACTQSDGLTALSTDQRGVTRPQGSACDIGAFELVEIADFPAFSAKLDVRPGSNGSFDLNSTFTLASGSSGINPLTDAVQLQVGPYQVTIPAGSFHQLAKGAKSGSYVYSGTIGGASLSVQIVPLGGNTYQFKASASPVDLSTLTNPVDITVTIGKNTGTVSVYADLGS